MNEVSERGRPEFERRRSAEIAGRTHLDNLVPESVVRLAFFFFRRSALSVLHNHVDRLNDSSASFNTDEATELDAIVTSSRVQVNGKRGFRLKLVSIDSCSLKGYCCYPAAL